MREVSIAGHENDDFGTRRRHHCRVHLDPARGREDGAIAGIEERIVFEGDDRGHDRIEGGTAAAENVRTALHRGEDAGVAVPATMTNGKAPTRSDPPTGWR